MISFKMENIYKITVSFAFGFLGFFCNFHTIIFPFGGYTVAVLFGLLFPLLISLSWGWKYGLLSALAGGCQTMWWLWGPSNGYAIFLVAPPFTFWIVWHGIFAGFRSKTKEHKWWLNMYIVEIPFRVLCSINLLIFGRWAITHNPPPWNWAADSINTVPMHFSVFVTFKQACVAFVLLLAADVLLNIKYVRTFLKLEPVVDQRRTGYIVSIFLLIGCLFWLLDSIFHTLAFDGGRSFIEFLALDIPESNLFTRIVFLLFCMASGMVTSKILRKQKQGDEQIRLSEEKFRTFFMLGRVGMAITSPDKGWVQVNEQLCDLLGYSVEELQKTTWGELTHPDDLAADVKQFNRVLTNEIDTYSIEKRFIRKDGSIIPTTLWLSCVRNSDKSVKYFIVHLADNTLRKQAENEKIELEAQLHQSQKLESIGTLAGGIAHDFNNILSAVIGFTELALDAVEKGTPIEEDLQEVYRGGIRARELVAQILTFARQSNEELKPIQVDLTIKEVLKFIRSSIPTTIEIKQNIESDSLIMGNSTQVHQIMMNLCTNAAHAMAAEGGVLEITQKDITIDRTTNQKKLKLKFGKYIELKVSDTGTGMEPHILEKVFEPYFTTKKQGEGTGMGLALVHGIVKEYGGDMIGESTLGKGTVITLYLPIAREKCAPLAYKSNELPTGQERILFVDDEAPIVKAGNRILGQLGYSVTSRTSSVEALELFQSKPDDFDLVISDVTMPIMTGDILANNLLQIRPSIPIILCTGGSTSLLEDKVSQAGIRALIYKPLVKEVLAQTIRKVLDEEEDVV